MAARIRKIRHDDETRAKIQTANIIYRLTQGFNGKVDLTPAQISIGLGLLRKTLPDLAVHTLEGNPDKPLNVVERRIIDPQD